MAFHILYHQELQLILQELKLPLQTVRGANIFLGKSVRSVIRIFTTSLTTSGIVNQAKTDANSKLSEFNDDLLLIDDKVATLTKRYKTQFSAMEQIVTN